MSDARAKALKLACAAGIFHALLSTAAFAGPVIVSREVQDAGPSVKPGDDFDGYANGAWLRTAAMPEGRSTYDTSFMLRTEAAGHVRDLVGAAARAPTSERERRVGDYYASWMDVAAIDADGLRPVADDLAAIASIHDRRTLASYLGGALRLDDGTNTRTDGLFGVWIHQGFHDGDHYAPHLMQGGLGLSDRDAYADTPEVAQALDAYRTHIAATLTLLGRDGADERAGRVLALETAIARTHASRADTDDVFKTDNVWRRADFAAKAPGMDWNAWFEASRLAGEDAFVVWQPSAVTGASALAGSEPIETWRDYLAFHLVGHYSGVLPAAFGGRTADRGQQALDATTAALGQDIGQLYVARFFPPEAKAAAAAMAENIRAAFRPHLETIGWMSPEARQVALGKLETLRIGVGYPDAWTDYAGLAVTRTDAYGNMRRAEAFAYQNELAKLGRPVDPAEWGILLPQRPGAIINFSPNALQFSAAIFQPPFFDAGGDSAANYGSAGAGMAHEVGHTFDELGSIYDAQGRLMPWWSPADLAGYQDALAPLAAQLAAYCPAPDLCVNGPQVVAETAADLVGVRVAYDAYKRSLNGQPDVVRDGLTGDQRFFLAFAQRWRRLQTDAARRQQFAADNHAPGPYRAATVRNMDEWTRAWDVKPGEALYLAPEDRVRIW